MERPVIRAGIAAAGDPRLGTAHCYRNPIHLAKPAKGKVQVIVHRGIAAANGATSRSEYTTVVK
jgi:hypothetical protein